LVLGHEVPALWAVLLEDSVIPAEAELVEEVGQPPDEAEKQGFGATFTVPATLRHHLTPLRQLS
jgi:hypothetical protein